MKKTVIILCLVGSALLILDSLNAAESLVLFFFAGIIPGTNLRISAIDMMAAIATAITIVILRITAWPLLRSSFTEAPAKPTMRAKRTTRTTA